MLISRDGGATFRTLLTLADFGGAAFTPEGRLWIGDGGNIFDRDAPQGLWVATDTGTQLQHVGDARTTCLAYHPGSHTLFACQTQSIGRIRVEDGSYEALMRSQAAQEFVQCDGVDLPAACEMQLCGAYCGMGHFPQAPLCRAYTGPFSAGRRLRARGQSWSMPVSPPRVLTPVRRMLVTRGRATPARRRCMARTAVAASSPAPAGPRTHSSHCSQRPQR